jgi:hypothetical protein
MKYQFYIAVTFIFLVLSCHTSKSRVPDTRNTTGLWPWVIKYDRGSCFGECPVYTFYLLADHHGLIDVRYNLLEPGWYEADLDQEAVHQLISDIEPESWWNQDLSDLPEIADLPGLSLLYKHKDGLRWIATRGKMSGSMTDVFQNLDHMVTEARWKPTQQRPLNPEIPEPTDVLVQLKEGVDIQMWMKKFEHYGIRLKKKVAPKMQFYVVSKDPSIGSANDFLQYIKLDPEVIEAQWDHALSSRN